MCRIILQSAACCAALPFGTLSVALFIQHVNLISMCRIILQSAACCAALPFSTLSYKLHEFRRRFIEYKMCVPIFSPVLSETFLILRTI